MGADKGRMTVERNNDKERVDEYSDSSRRVLLQRFRQKWKVLLFIFWIKMRALLYLLWEN